jgi:hypothetical protein
LNKHKLTSLRNKVGDSKINIFLKANKPKETGSQEKPDNQAARTHKHRLLIRPNAWAVFGYGSNDMYYKTAERQLNINDCLAEWLVTMTIRSRFELVRAHDCKIRTFISESLMFIYRMDFWDEPVRANFWIVILIRKSKPRDNSIFFLR